MTQFARASFDAPDSTILDLYVDIGAWSNYSASGINAYIVSNVLFFNEASNTGSATYLNSGTPANKNYNVSATFGRNGTQLGYIGLLARCDASFVNFYFVYFNQADGTWYLDVQGATYQNLGTYSDSGWTGSKAVILSCNESTIKVIIDGVDRISVTDTQVTQVGKSGLSLNATHNENGPCWMNDFSGDDISADTLMAQACL